MFSSGPFLLGRDVLRARVWVCGEIRCTIRTISESGQNPTNIGPHWFGLDFDDMKCCTDIVPEELSRITIIPAR